MIFAFLESNFLPSVTVVTPPDQGIQSRLQSQANNEPVYDGVTLDQLWANRDISRYDPIDRIGIVTSKLNRTMSDYQKSQFHRDFTNAFYKQNQKS